MGRRNEKKEELNRLTAKTLDAKFRLELVKGLNCSPFEAEAVLEVVKEIYLPYLDPQTSSMPPGKISLLVIGSDECAGKPVISSKKVNVCLTVHRGEEDDRLLRQKGAAVFRQARIPDLCQEALSQGGLLTREDLAYRIFFVSTRTITRDIMEIRRVNPTVVVPMRGMVQDIGPVITHREQIIRLALQGHTLTQICQKMQHSPHAVTNYLSTFIRCAQLQEQGMESGQIAFLLHRGRGLIERYLELLVVCQKDATMKDHLSEMLTLGFHRGEKKQAGRIRP